MNEHYTTDNLNLAAFLFGENPLDLVNWRDISAQNPSRARRNHGKPVYEFIFSRASVQNKLADEFAESPEYRYLTAIADLREKIASDKGGETTSGQRR